MKSIIVASTLPLACRASLVVYIQCMLYMHNEVERVVFSTIMHRFQL